MRRAIYGLVALGLVAGLPSPASLIGPAPAEARAAEGQSTRGLYLELIRQARSDGKPRAALAFLDDFDRTYPGDVEAVVLRINCLLDLEAVTEAALLAERLPTGPRAAALGSEAVRGHVSAAQQDWRKAVRHYENAIKSKPADAYLLSALGYARIQAGSARQAIADLSAASELAPRSPVIRNNLMLAMLLGGDASGVRAMLQTITDDAERQEVDATLEAEARAIIERLANRAPAAAPITEQGDEA